jgi:anaerobic selenocysteine-containing dehydrogenase
MFNVPTALNATGFAEEPGLFRLITLRSNDQFNTTVYGYSDRFRGVEGTREVLFINPRDMQALGLRAGALVSLVGVSTEDTVRRMDNLRVVPYDIPPGCVGAYYPECNGLIAVSHHAQESHVPAAKSVPVRIELSGPPGV